MYEIFTETRKRRCLMRISMIYSLILIGGFQLLFASNSRGQSLEEIIVTIKPADKNLEHLLKDIELQTHLTFAYLPSDVRKYNNIGLQPGKQSVKTALDKALNRTELSYRYVENSIIIFPRRDIDKRKALVLTPGVRSNDISMSSSSRAAGREVVQTLSISTPLKIFERRLIRSISGRVIDSEGEPLIGVNIQVKDSSKGTATDFDGNFTLEDIDENAVLVVSYVGYQTQEVTLAGKSSLEIVMTSDSQLLDEVVVVGYGTQKKVNLTGAVSSVSSEEISGRHFGQTSMALQGMASGVTVVQPSGQPGKDGGIIRIRGIGTLGDANPLILIDGIPGDINNVDPNIIENISILKDAASSSIYGARAANGVILITTKRGQEGRFVINYSNYMGIQQPTNLKKRVDAIDHMSMMNLANENLGRSPIFSQDIIDNYESLNHKDPYTYPNTDWFKEIYTESGFMQNHNLNFTGGNDRLRVMGALGYLNQAGILKSTGFERYTFRMNSDILATSRLRFKTDVFLQLMNINEPSNIGSVIFNTAHMASNEPTSNVFGFAEPSTSQNPLALLHEGGYNRILNPSLMTTLGFTYNFVDNVLLEFNYTPHFWLEDTKRFRRVINTYYSNGSRANSGNQVEGLDQKDNKYLHNNYYLTFKYDGSWGGSKFNALIGASQEDYHYRWFGAYRDDFTLPNFDVLNAGSANNQQATGAGEDWAIRSLFGRLNYNYDNKYLLETNFRYDGSSRFSKGNKYGFFPSFSLGWRTSEERFWMISDDLVSDFKLRASWGILGNQNIGTYPFDSYLTTTAHVFNGAVINGLTATEMANPSISWESSKMINVGFDLELGQKFNISYDYFIKNTSGILLRLDIPSIIGLSAPYQNAGEVENKGWDLSLNYREQVDNFDFNITGTLSDVKNKILDLKGVNVEGLLVNFEDYPMTSFYGYQAIGYFQNQEEIDSSPRQFGNVIPGSIKYADLNGDGKIDGEDRAIIGNQIPRYTYSLNTNIGWRNWDFNFFLQGVGKVDGYLYGTAIMPFDNGSTALEMHKDYWTENNLYAAFPSLAFNEPNNIQNSSFWVKDASYLRLKNIQLGFTFPSNFIDLINIEKIRFYISGTNLLTFDRFWKGFDVEAPVGDGSFYPQLKTYSAGVNLSF